MSAIDDSEDRPLREDDGDDPNLAEFQRLKREINDAQRARSKWREEACKSYDYVAGHQWSDEDSTQLAEQHRPAVTFNRVEPLVKAVCGLEVNNRQSVIYLPRQQESTGPNEMITAAGKWIRDECFAEDEESEAFRDTAICGEGWTETYMDFDEDPQGKVVKERIDPLEMGVNKGATRANYIDARMIYRVRKMDPEDVRALLGLDDTIIDAALDASKWIDAQLGVPADGGKAMKKDYPKTTRAGVMEKGKLKEVTIVQCQYWKRETINMVATANDAEPVKMSNDEFEDFKLKAAQLQEAGTPLEYEHAQTTRKVFYQCFIGSRILDSQPMELNEFQFKAMTGERDRKLKCFYGMVRGMIDPQMWSNKFLSQTMHHINVNAKGGLLAESDTFLNVRKAERDWADPTKIVWVKPGSLQKQKVKERQSIALPPGLDQLMMFAISSIRDVTGINLELLGQADREQAASLEQQRKQSAMTILATMFDSLRKYRKHDGRLLLQFIKRLPEGTLIRVVKQGQYQYIPLIKSNVDFDKFDTIIDQTPTSPNEKQFIWAITAQILQMGILPPPAIIALLKYSPYPESVVKEIQDALGLNGDLPPDQLKQKLDQAEQALQVLEGQLHELQAQAKTAEDDKSIEMLKIEIDEYKAETERLKAQWDSRIKMAGAIATAASGDADRAHEADENAAERGHAATQAASDRVVAMAGQVTTGKQELPDVSGASAGTVPQTQMLEQKIDALAAMVQQLVQTIQPPQQAEAAPQPVEEPPAEPQ